MAIPTINPINPIGRAEMGLRVFLLACIIQGEAGVMPPTARLAVARVVLNRVADWNWITWGDVAEQFYGFYSIRRPTKENLGLARSALEIGPSHKFYFVFSKQDVEKLGLEKAPLVFVSGPWELHFYKKRH